MKDMNDDRAINVKALINELVGDLLDLADLEGREVTDRVRLEQAIGRRDDK